VHDRKSKLMGHTNPYVTGEKVWHEGYKPASQRNTGAYKAVPSHQSIASQVITMQVRGNKKSKIYHLPHCPSFDAISEKNRVEFTTESDALNAGFRKAGNCK
jgi:deoxyribonuclease I